MSNQRLPWRACRSVMYPVCLLLLLFPLAACRATQPIGPPVKVGLIAPLSGPLAASGQAIQRGILLAIDEVNRAGGVLGRPLQLVLRDIQNDPPAGVAALSELVAQEQIVAVFGGIFSPVMLAQLDEVHRVRLPLINPWGSVAEITKNGRKPNYAFRVSLSDETADEFLTRYLIGRLGARRPGILADTTAWGESNVKGLTQWLAEYGLQAAAVERFAQGDKDMRLQVRRLAAAGADSILLVANAPEGAAVVRAMATAGWKVPVVAHWGISGGRFVEQAGPENLGNMHTIQTFSFMGDLSPIARKLLDMHHLRFGTGRAEEVAAPVGVAHGYDGLHLLARAIQRAGTTDGDKVRDALEHLGPYNGVVKRYAPAFTPQNHDSLDATDYIMTVWRGTTLVPTAWPRPEK